MGGHGARAAVEVSGDGETANGVCGDGAEEREEVQREQRRGRERGSKRLWPVHNRFAGPGRDFGAAAGVAESAQPPQQQQPQQQQKQQPQQRKASRWRKRGGVERGGVGSGPWAGCSRGGVACSFWLRGVWGGVEGATVERNPGVQVPHSLSLALTLSACGEVRFR
jgi:hypothetical protein